MGFGLGIVIGVTLGIAIGWFKPFEKIIDSVLQFFRQPSAPALFPVFPLFFGLGEPSKYAIVTWAALWPILLTTIFCSGSGGEAADRRGQAGGGPAAGSSSRKWFCLRRSRASCQELESSGAYAITVLVAAEMGGSNRPAWAYSPSQCNRPSEFRRCTAGILLLGILGLCRERSAGAGGNDVSPAGRRITNG